MKSILKMKLGSEQVVRPQVFVKKIVKNNKSENDIGCESVKMRQRLNSGLSEF